MYYDKFVNLLQKNNVSAYKVSKETKIASSNFTDWKNGKITPKNQSLQKIADYFNVPLSYFIGEENEPQEDHEADFLSDFYSLDKDDREEIEEIIRIKLKKEKYLKKKK